MACFFSSSLLLFFFLLTLVSYNTTNMTRLLLILIAFLPMMGQGQYEYITDDLKAIEPQVIEWRRHLHQNPELSNREFNTQKYIAAHLKSLGIPADLSYGKTGVVGVLEGGLPGPSIALRADIDALPVTERVDVPFASKVKTTYLSEDVGVMHACGHDSHTAMLMGTASLLSKHKDKLKGRVVFIFQPAEEGAPPGEEGGAQLMLKEGVFEKYPVDVVFGLHIWASVAAGSINYRPGGMLAASDRLEITVHGKQTHGSRPWGGVDPITVSAQMILGIQNIISRQTELTKAPAVITIGKIKGGVRNNIIPESVEMIGTIRTFDDDMQDEIHRRIEQTATAIAESAGATADVRITRGYPVTVNDYELTKFAVNSLYRTAGEDNVFLINPVTGAEDFSYFANTVPGFFFFLGGRNPDIQESEAAPHHTPDFYLDESGFILGVETFYNLVMDYGMEN
jgi:amidohydrolase